jgi:hypothetical protein
MYGKVAADAIDSVGNLMTDVVEGKYWDSNTNSNQRKRRNQNQNSNGDNCDNGDGDSESDTSQSHYQNGRGKSFQKRSRKRKRHWRDRLAEKFDYALGVHEEGKYYQTWEEKLERQKRSEVGNDPVSIFYGNQKRDHGPKKNVAFWDEDGSLMSLLFGRSPTGQKLLAFKVSVALCLS